MLQPSEGIAHPREWQPHEPIVEHVLHRSRELIGEALSYRGDRSALQMNPGRERRPHETRQWRLWGRPEWQPHESDLPS